MPHAALYVSRLFTEWDKVQKCRVSMPHAALCVSRPQVQETRQEEESRFNAARSIVCVETTSLRLLPRLVKSFNAARSIVCVETGEVQTSHLYVGCFNAARSIVCVETVDRKCPLERHDRVSMPHAALCVSRHCVPQPLSRAG